MAAGAELAQGRGRKAWVSSPVVDRVVARTDVRPYPIRPIRKFSRNTSAISECSEAR